MPRLGLKIKEVGLNILKRADGLWIGQVELEIEEIGSKNVDNSRTIGPTTK